MKKLSILIVILLIGLIMLTACDVQKEQKGVQSAFVDDDGYLVLIYTDGTEETAGYVVGRNGKDGQDGKDGKNGIDGRNGIDGKDGLNGTNGKDGEKGDKGDQGIAGPQGEKGDQGPQGIQGEKGEKGDVGEKGEKGDRGEQGIAGRDGVDGKNGVDGQDGKDSVRYVETIKSLPLTFYEDYDFTKLKKGDKLEWYAFQISYSPYLGTWGYPIYKETLSQFPTNDLNNGIGDVRRITLNGITRTNTPRCYGINSNDFHDLSGQQTVYICGTVTKAGYTDTYYGNYRQYWVYIDVELVVEANYLVAHYPEFCV